MLARLATAAQPRARQPAASSPCSPWPASPPVLVARSGVVSSTSLVYAAALPRRSSRRPHRAAHAAAAGRSVPAPAGRDPRLGSGSARSTASAPRSRATRRSGWRSASRSSSAVLVLLPDFRVLERYRYLCGALALGLLAVTIASSYATHTVINGARVWIRVGGLSFQPAELAKILLVLFLAGYLRERRELLAQTPTRVLGIGLPPLRQLAPLLGDARRSPAAARRDERLRDVAALLRRVRGARVRRDRPGRVCRDRPRARSQAAARWRTRSRPQVAERVSIWLDPWKTAQSSGYQIVQSLYTVADGGLFGSGPRPRLHPHRRRAARSSPRCRPTSSTPRSRASSGSPAPPRSCSATC